MTNSCEKKIKHGDVKAVYQLGLWQQWPLLAHFLLACRDVCLLNVGIKHDFKVSQGLCAYKHEGPSGIPRTQLKKKKKAKREGTYCNSSRGGSRRSSGLTGQLVLFVLFVLFVSSSLGETLSQNTAQMAPVHSGFVHCVWRCVCGAHV
jgi:hypothetical protein